MKTIHINIGDEVICDWCSDDFTDSDAKGGFLFQSKATCPTCAPGIEASAKKYGEERFIRERCPDGMTFKEFVLRLRSGNNSITVFEA